MLGAMLAFLVGALFLAVILYILNLILARITLPADIKQIVLAIFGLIGLVLLVMLAVNVFNGGFLWLRL